MQRQLFVPSWAAYVDTELITNFWQPMENIWAVQEIILKYKS